MKKAILPLLLAVLLCAAVGAQAQYPPPAGGPTATTLPASPVTDTSGTLNGRVNAEGGSSATYAFNIGPAGGSFTTSTPEFTVAGTQDHNVSVTFTELAPGTTYIFRVRPGASPSGVVVRSLSEEMALGSACPHRQPTPEIG